MIIFTCKVFYDSPSVLQSTEVKKYIGTKKNNNENPITILHFKRSSRQNNHIIDFILNTFSYSREHAVIIYIYIYS